MSGLEANEALNGLLPEAKNVRGGEVFEAGKAGTLPQVIGGKNYRIEMQMESLLTVAAKVADVPCINIMKLMAGEGLEDSYSTPCRFLSIAVTATQEEREALQGMAVKLKSLKNAAIAAGGKPVMTDRTNLLSAETEAGKDEVAGSTAKEPAEAASSTGKKKAEAAGSTGKQAKTVGATSYNGKKKSAKAAGAGKGKQAKTAGAVSTTNDKKMSDKPAGAGKATKKRKGTGGIQDFFLREEKPGKSTKAARRVTNGPDSEDGFSSDDASIGGLSRKASTAKKELPSLMGDENHGRKSTFQGLDNMPEKRQRAKPRYSDFYPDEEFVFQDDATNTPDSESESDDE